MPPIPPDPLGKPGGRFEIRPYDLDCIRGLFAAADESRKELLPWMAWFHADYGMIDVANWAAHAMEAWEEQSSFEFVIYDRADGAVVGSCGLNEIREKDRFCNLGYWVRTSKTGLGAATESVSLMKAFAFERLDLNRLEIVMAVGNEASRAVAVKAGAIYEGIQHSRFCVRNEVHDAHMYALIRPRSSGE